ncbi:MAG: hypothetical protein IGS23_18010 [Rivularia sp. T60_A2020_040]|nr:hypothetical protein [Rivularia sp. T60_A2020_040]
MIFKSSGFQLGAIQIKLLKIGVGEEVGFLEPLSVSPDKLGKNPTSKNNYLVR